MRIMGLSDLFQWNKQPLLAVAPPVRLVRAWSLCYLKENYRGSFSMAHNYLCSVKAFDLPERYRAAFVQPKLREEYSLLRHPGSRCVSMAWHQLAWLIEGASYVCMVSSQGLTPGLSF